MGSFRNFVFVLHNRYRASSINSCITVSHAAAVKKYAAAVPLTTERACVAQNKGGVYQAFGWKVGSLRMDNCSPLWPITNNP